MLTASEQIGLASLLLSLIQLLFGDFQQRDANPKQKSEFAFTDVEVVVE